MRWNKGCMPLEGLGVTPELECAVRGRDGESIFIFPIDIFFKNPHRLPFSLLSLGGRGLTVALPFRSSFASLGDDVLSGTKDTRLCGS